MALRGREAASRTAASSTAASSTAASCTAASCTDAAGSSGTENRPGQLLTYQRGGASIQGFPPLRAFRAAHPRGRGGKSARYFLTAGARVLVS